MIHVSFPSRGARRSEFGAASRSAQRGVSLIIAMVMLVVIGFVSVAIMRNATSSDQVAMSNRLQTQASLYAQAALQFCEAQILLSAGTSPVKIQIHPDPQAWTVKDNWLKTQGGVYQLKTTDLPSANTPAHLPQCVIETDSVNKSLYIVTARGFSNDFDFDATSGATKAGSVVWLQSQVLAY